MKKRIAITLTEDAVKALDELLGYNKHLSKSQVIENLITKGLKSVKSKKNNR